MDITAFREQYPQYNDMSDTDLADALHQKYYSDVPKDQFYASFGVSPQQQQAQGPVQAPPPTGIFDTVGNAIGGAWNRAQSTFDNTVAETYRQAAVDQGKSFRDLAREKVADTGLTDLNGKPLDSISSIGPIDALSAALRYAFQSKDSKQAAQDYNKAVEWKKAAQDQANEGELKYPMTARGSERAKSLEDRTKDMSFSQDPVGSTYEVGKWFFEDPAGAALSFGEQAARSAAPIAVGAATTAVTKNPALGAMALGGSSYAMERYSSVDDFLKERGYDLNKPEDVQRALSDDKLMKEANDYGITRGVITGAADLLGAKLSGVKMSARPVVNAGGQVLAQAATDGGGEALAQLATKGKVNIADVVQEIGGGMVTSIPEAVAVGGQKTRDVVPGLGITSDAIDKMVGDKNSADNADAAARVAARINLYEAQGFDPTDVDPTADKGAKQILTGINMDLGNEIKQLYEKVKPLVSPRDDSVLTDIFDRAALATAVRKGVNRLKSGMTDADIAKVESLVGHTQEGFALVEKLKEAREVGRLYQRGVKGGLSRFTDTISPLSTEQGMFSPSNAMRLAATYAGGTATGGIMPIVQSAAFLGGRAIDSVTGNRSRVARYVRDYGNRNVLTPTITPPSGLRSLTGEQEALRLQKEAAQAARERAVAAAAMARVAEAERKKNVRETGLRLMRETIAKDEVPGGGFLRSIYDAHGLKPRQIVLGLNRLRTSGEIDASIADAFLLDPNSLMSGNVGNQIVDRLVRLADAGTISRDANWKPQAAQGPTVGMPGQTAQGPTMTSATRQPPMDERRRIAYEQQARANQERVSQTINAIQADQRIPDAIKPRLLEAAALIGKTNNKQEAQKIADGVDKALSFDIPLQMIAQSYLVPLVDQIRHTIDPNGPKPQAMRRSEAKITKARTEALTKAVVETGLEMAQSRQNATQSSTVVDAPELAFENLPSRVRDRTAIEILRGDDAKKGSRTVTDVAYALQDRALQTMREPLTVKNRTPETDRETALLIAAEALEEIKNNPRNAINWYSEEMQKAMLAASIIHPELATDPIARGIFALALAITSQGVVVSDNANYAMRWYKAYKDSIPQGENEFKGRFPEEGWGKAAPSIIANAKKVNKMIETEGPEWTLNFMMHDFTVKQLKEAGFKIGGEAVDTVVRGSAILGPKIGGGFFQNLMGNFDPVTIDMWLMRLWGRATGNLIGIDPKTAEKQVERFKQALIDEGTYNEEEHGTPEGLVDAAEQVAREWNRNFDSEAYNRGEQKKSEVVYAALRIMDGKKKSKDTPGSSAVRNWIRSVVRDAQSMLQQQGIDLTSADLQAIVWYPEKRLWTKKMGSREKGSGEDGADSAGETSYMHEFIRIAREEGYNEAQIQQALQSTPRGGTNGQEPVRSPSERVYGQDPEAEDNRQSALDTEDYLAGAISLNKGVTREAARAAREAVIAKEAAKKLKAEEKAERERQKAERTALKAQRALQKVQKAMKPKNI